jgi:hypothetical protein
MGGSGNECPGAINQQVISRGRTEIAAELNYM